MTEGCAGAAVPVSPGMGVAVAAGAGAGARVSDSASATSVIRAGASRPEGPIFLTVDNNSVMSRGFIIFLELIWITLDSFAALVGLAADVEGCGWGVEATGVRVTSVRPGMWREGVDTRLRGCWPPLLNLICVLPKGTMTLLFAWTAFAADFTTIGPLFASGLG